MPVTATSTFCRSAQRTLTEIVFDLPAAPLLSVTVSIALKLPLLVYTCGLIPEMVPALEVLPAVALPSPTIDFRVVDGVNEIPIEQRSGTEVSQMTGRTRDGRIETVEIVPEGSPVANYAFDVTPARYVTGLITERGVIAANRVAIAKAFPERAG